MAHAAFVDRPFSATDAAAGDGADLPGISSSSFLRAEFLEAPFAANSSDVIAFDRAPREAVPVARHLRLVPDRRSIARLAAFQASCLASFRAESGLEIQRQSAYGRDLAFLERLSAEAADDRATAALGLDRITLLRRSHRLVRQEKRDRKRARRFEATRRMREIEKRLLDEEAYRHRRLTPERAGITLAA